MPRKASVTQKKKGPAKSDAGAAASFPASVAPMLATLTDAPFDDDGWIYEIKWDGYRTIAQMHKDGVELRSRNDKSFNEKFYPVTEAVKKWGLNAVVDGEIIVADPANGISDFGALQNWRSEADGELLYYVFDILWLDGRDLTPLPLEERRKILQKHLPKKGLIRMSRNFGESATEFLEVAKKLGLEGIIAKKKGSAYVPGTRTREWLKIKANKRQEMVIGGYTRNEGSSKPFSSLLVGIFEKGKLVYTGKVGTGFNAATQKELLQRFKKLTVKKPPFTEVPDINKPSRFRPDPPKAEAVWLRPELVCEVSYAEMTADGVMRHPSFEGLRIDKDAKDVVPEKKASPPKPGNKKQAVVEPPAKRDRSTLLNPKDETQVRLVNGHELKFTNLSKIYWPKEKITKRDLINYYYRVAPFMLPYLEGRPQSMNRHPDGINGESFYYKDVTGKAPSWIKTYRYHSDADDRDRNYLVCTDEASLLYMASLGCIEMNPWSSKASRPDRPDWCIIDLDPGKATTFGQVIRAAQVTKDVLDEMGAASYPKTSGSTGMHIYIPLGAKYSYEQSKEFARIVAKQVHARLPKLTSIERIVKNRGGKMYVDFLQNRPQATVSAPYSLRPKPGATVSMPLHWEEVKTGLKMRDFTIDNALERIRSEGDLFRPVLGKGIPLVSIMKDWE